jgi:hypothetical protein
MGGSDQKELLLVQRGESDQANAVAVLYRYRNKSMIRSVEVELSRPAANVKRISAGTLQCGTPAVYVSTAEEGSSIRTDVLALKEDRLSRVAVQDSMDDHVQSTYYVYAEDVDDDGVMEIPVVIPVQPLPDVWNQTDQYLIRWKSIDLDGQVTEKLNSFHNYEDGWYLILNSDWTEHMTVYQVGTTYVFYMWDKEFQETQQLFTVFALSGSDRVSQATEDGRFLLHSGDDVVYAAKLEADAALYDIDKMYLSDHFHLIHKVWNTGEA